MPSHAGVQQGDIAEQPLVIVLLNSFGNHAGFKRWREQGIDMVGRLVEETKRRNLECFWHHRVSEVDLRRDGKGAAWKDAPDPLKQAHPDWTLKCWWPHGLWDFSHPDVRQITVDSLREVAEQYDDIDYGELIAIGTPIELMEKHAAQDLESVFLKITGRRIAEGS